MEKVLATGLIIASQLLAFAGICKADATEYRELVVMRTANQEVLESVSHLADLFEATTGHRPKVRWHRMIELDKSILIGAAPRHQLFDADPLTDEVLVERTSRGLEIRGSDNTATVFAVYRFIENFLGWRYYQPGELGMERLDTPPGLPEVEGESGVLLLEKAGFYSRNLTGLETENETISWAKWHCLRERFAFNHHLHRVITPDHFESHPEWFAKRQNGKPKSPPYPIAHGHNDHPDLSEPGVRTAAVSDFMKAFNGARSSTGIAAHSLSLADSFVFAGFPFVLLGIPPKFK